MANHLIPAIAESIQKNWDSPALSDFKGATSTFRQVAEEIARLQIIFSAAGVKQGDKVALLGFGTFSVNERPARTGINPATKEKIQIEAKKVIKFKPGAELAASIK